MSNGGTGEWRGASGDGSCAVRGCVCRHIRRVAKRLAFLFQWAGDGAYFLNVTIERIGKTFLNQRIMDKLPSFLTTHQAGAFKNTKML